MATGKILARVRHEGRGRRRHSALTVAATVKTKLYEYLVSGGGTIDQRSTKAELMAAA